MSQTSLRPIEDTSAFWRCYYSEPDEYEGELLWCKLKDEYNEFRSEDPNDFKQVAAKKDEKMRAIYPAVEPPNISSAGKLLLKNRAFYPYAGLLGYIVIHNAFSLPNVKSFKARIAKRWDNRIHLRIEEKPGIKNDLDYIKAYTEFDIILGECPHDDFSHAICVLNMIYESHEEYFREKKRLSADIQKIHQRLLIAARAIEKGNKSLTRRELSKITVVVSAQVDGLWGVNKLKRLKGFNLNVFQQSPYQFLNIILPRLSNLEPSYFWARRFDDEAYDIVQMRDIWERVIEIEKREMVQEVFSGIQ